MKNKTGKYWLAGISLILILAVIGLSLNHNQKETQQSKQKTVENKTEKTEAGTPAGTIEVQSNTVTVTVE